MIRLATTEDMPAILEMAKRFHASSPWAFMPIDEAHLTAHMTQFIDGDNSAVFVLDDMTGGIGLFVSPVYFSDTKVAQETFWYCESPGNGGALLDVAERWAKNMGAAQMSMICLEGKNTDIVGKIYERRGYRPTEHTYMKAL
jgi:hypothetical protein